MSFTINHPYKINGSFKKRVAYFSMEFAIHQSLKGYSGGLGFLAGSHMRSAYELKQNIVGIGILWKYGYYDQVRKSDQGMDVLFLEKVYGFLQQTGIQFTITINKHPVQVTAYYLPPEVFNTAPIFFLSTDLPENDYLAQSISFKLYDSNPEARIAADILLGVGGFKLLQELKWEPEIYHLNESHALPLAFSLYNKYKNISEVRKRLVFTNHTPESAGNKKTDIFLLDKMSFFQGMSLDNIRKNAGIDGDFLDHTLTALRVAGKTNAVSKMHQQTICGMWQDDDKTCDIIPITNAQNFTYWADAEMYKALQENNDETLKKRKSAGKHLLFEEVGDQSGEIYDEKVLTIVFAKRFAGYKRAELLLCDTERFHRMVTNKEMPLQIIWAGKPYPMDYTSIASFDRIANLCKKYSNCSILVGHEMKLSRLLKQGADVWLNVPRLTHEASGTSGMSAAMNGAINVSIPDGWFPEFAKHGHNSFIIPAALPSQHQHEQDEADANALYSVLENEVIPMYYNNPGHWLSIIKNSMREIIPQFDSNRMAEEYYTKLYNPV